MNSGVSEVDDPNFFLAKNGDRDASAELEATLEAFYSNELKDDNSTICRFPARYNWLKSKLQATDFPKATCPKYSKVLKRVDPKSVTFVFPAAHINSPASMFGHTFLRINSSYNSKLLAYAVNYAADANMDTENGFTFAIKGLFGGYYGKYSLLPYYDKLKEYRDSEQRDIWEYDLNLTQEETLNMFNHVWELNNINSYYYFFTENCSYNMLWLLEVARPTLHLREQFTYQVTPLETIHVAKEAGIISAKSYRPSKRTTLLKYEGLLDDAYIDLPTKIIQEKVLIDEIIEKKSISSSQKKYILEAAIEYLEYQRSEGKLSKEKYLSLFHQLTTSRAQLGKGEDLNITAPANPIDGHRAVRTQIGLGSLDGELVSYLGIRPAYHSLEDSSYGFLRGTQIEFMDVLLAYSNDAVKVQRATILSIVSLTQRSEFFKSFSWRTKFGFDSDSMDKNSRFSGSVGAGYSWGNELAYVYFLVDPFFYAQDGLTSGVGGSIGFSIDKYDFMNTNVEFTQRIYDTGENQTLFKLNQGFRVSQNTQIMVNYDYKDKLVNNIKIDENSFKAMLKYYF